ncbi:hypothetical protein HN51_023215, partial [Arachis hypogaea]
LSQQSCLKRKNVSTILVCTLHSRSCCKRNGHQQDYSIGELVIYGTELFPTCVRNSALSLVRQAGVLGGTLCPMLVAIGRGNKFLCYGVFGLAIGCSGLFLVCLPETKGKAFCDTIH